MPKRAALNRRAFLRGVGAVAVGLPFLESLPQRSAWAQDAEPRFAFFVGTANGVVRERFWPTEMGALSGLASDENAASALAEFADRTLFIQGLTYPSSPLGDTHSVSYCQMLTGLPPDSSSKDAMATGPSIDTLLAPVLNPDGAPPMATYSGMKAGYINERMSFIEAGVLRPAEGDPYVVYQDLLMAGAPADASDPELMAQIDDVARRRQSAIDQVRDELLALQGRAGLGAADVQRMELHLSSLRDIELNLDEPPPDSRGCAIETVDVAGIEALGERYRENGKVEEVALMQMQLVAFAFACNINHVATLQHGDGLDSSVYDVPSNERRWTFHHISHRVQSDGATGNDPLALEAHAEIDRVRLETFATGLQSFAAHGLLDKAIVMWANQFADGPSGSPHNLPTILVGDAGGALISGQHLRVGAESNGFGSASEHNGRLLTTLGSALGVPIEIDPTGSGAEQPLTELLAS